MGFSLHPFLLDLVVDDVALFQLPGHILYGDAVNGKGDAILEPGFHPVGIHVEAAGKQFVHRKPLSILR